MPPTKRPGAKRWSGSNCSLICLFTSVITFRSKLSRLLLSNQRLLRPALASHNLRSLAHFAYFDDTPCHRLTTEGIFVLQCGDPTGTGTGGPGYSVADELSGEETYEAGTLAMANAGPNTNGSQFFIVTTDAAPWLDGKHTVFGQVRDKAGELRDAVNDNRQYLENGPLGMPHVPFDTYGDGFHYGTWIWWRSPPSPIWPRSVGRTACSRITA